MRLAGLAILALLTSACVARPDNVPASPQGAPIEIGLIDGLGAALIAEGLSNPTHVSFRPGDGAVTVCDSANGRVLLIGSDGKPTEYLAGFPTEYWKKLSPTDNLYKIGPLFALWLNGRDLVVGDGGLPDGAETVNLYTGPGEGASPASRTNAIGPTSDPRVETDLGEGNYVGPAIGPDGTIYVAAHGNDAKSWIAAVDIKAGTLRTLFSSDEGGVPTNAPMQCLIVRGNLLVLYAGAGGKSESLAVEWDLKTFKPVNRWALPGITDAMGIAPIPGRDDEYVVTDNNWDLRGVNPGRLARVSLKPGSEAAVQIIADRVMGPVHCAFGPDGRLYVTCLGEMFDTNKGQLLAITGIR